MILCTVPSLIWMMFPGGRDCVICVLPVPGTVPGTYHYLYINESKNEAGDLRPRNRCDWGPPQLPSSCPAPSPLEVGQLLLQQEHVGFELIPLLKDLLKLLSTEAALPYVGGTLWWIPSRRAGLVRGLP